MEKSSVFPLNPKKTAFVAVDLQNDLPFDYQPYPYREITANAGKIAELFDQAGALNVFLKITTKDGKDMLNPISDHSLAIQAAGNQPAVFDRAAHEALTPELAKFESSAHLIEKHQWGSFYGTDLDLQLRRRGIDTIVLAGVATGFGVDTTAREAYQHGYTIIFAEDAMGALTAQEHQYVVNYMFPFMGLVRSTKEILEQGFE